MYKRSIVFKCAPLFCSCSICIVLWMGPKDCVCSIRCSAKLEGWLAVLKAFLCSLKRGRNFCQFALHMPFHSRGMSTCILPTVNVNLPFVVYALTIFV